MSTQDFMDGKSIQVKLNDGHENINTRIKAYNTATQLIGKKNPECPTFYMEENTQEYEQVLETLGWAKDSSFEEILLGEGNAFEIINKKENLQDKKKKIQNVSIKRGTNQKMISSFSMA